MKTKKEKIVRFVIYLRIFFPFIFNILQNDMEIEQLNSVKNVRDSNLKEEYQLIPRFFN